MKGKKLYDAITNVEEKYIEEARDAKLKKESNKKIKWMAIAASFVLLLGISSIYLLQNMDGSSGGDGSPQGKSDTFMYYAGPVFPLTLDIEDDEITSSRNITYDFSFPQEDSLRVWGANVKDGYIFNNHSESEKTVKVIYPFVGTYDKLKEEMPRIDLNEQKTETTLYAGGYKGDLTGNKLLEDHNDSVKSIELRKWENYRTLLQDGTYKRNAFSSYPDLSQKVTVYTFSDFKAPNEYDAATQAISFHIDPNKTTILHYGFNGAEFKEDGSRSYSYFVPREDQLYRNGKKVLVVIVKEFQPEDYNKLRFYDDKQLSLNNLYGIKSKLNDLLKEKVWLKSGGTIIIQVTEALTAIMLTHQKL